MREGLLGPGVERFSVVVEGWHVTEVLDHGVNVLVHLAHCQVDDAARLELFLGLHSIDLQIHSSHR